MVRRQLIVIMFTDMVGYSALSQRNEALALDLLEKHWELLRPVISDSDGREIKTIGDAFLIEFSSALNAVNAGLTMQEVLKAYNSTVDEDHQITIRIGIHMGDVERRGDDVFGDGVNIAARLEPLSAPGGICISDPVYASVHNKVDVTFYSMGEQKLKNISQPIVTYSNNIELQQKKLFGSTRAKLAVSVSTLASISVAIWLIWAGYFVDKQFDGQINRQAADIPVVAVLPMKNLTGDPELEWFSEGLANLIRDNLTSSQSLRVVSPQRLMKIVGDTRQISEMEIISFDAGIGFILSGEIIGTQDGFTITTRLSNTDTGLASSARRMENLSPENLLLASKSIATQVKQDLKVPHTEHVDVYAADFAAQNLAAYELYLSGLQYYTNYEYESAVNAFSTAIEISPDFAVAMYRLAFIQATLGSTELAIASVTEALEITPIGDREYRYISAALSLFNRDYDSAASQYEEIIANYPFEIEARKLLAQCYWGQYRGEDAVNTLLKLAEWIPEEQVVWSSLGGYYLQMGQIDKAKPAIDKFNELAPDNPNSYALLGDLSRAQGEFDQALAYYNKALEIDPNLRDIEINLATIQYMRGHYQQAEDLFLEIAANTNSTLSDRVIAVLHIASLLKARGAFTAAAEIITDYANEIEQQKVREAMSKSTQGLIYLELHQYDTGKELIGSAISMSPGVPTRYLFARGIWELETAVFNDVQNTANEILDFALPPEDTDRTEEKAASYLVGMIHLLQHRLDQAELHLNKSITLNGYNYSVYEIGYARLLREKGQHKEALDLINKAIVPDLVDPRIDLEPERVRALLLLADIASEMGDSESAKGYAHRFRARFGKSSPDHAAVLEASRLIDQP